ncbi:MAG: hypothetical protein ACR2KT_18550 [Methylocella sp.]
MLPLNRFIFALGIRHGDETNARRQLCWVVRGAARNRASVIGRADARAEINNIKGIGEVVAELLDWPVVVFYLLTRHCRK